MRFKMKIVAVIPARINTKRVPNKMLRIVGNHPLVYYAIQNAKKSKYVTDIIVTTDSEQIALIAKQLSVSCVMRNEDICGDETPLDIVIYNVIDRMICDYVVTMQPTSPLLKVETLDKALEYAIKNDYDSMISVHNEPKLSWKKFSDNCLPEYEKRLNSQYLPPHYVETGAFLISKKKCVLPDSRIGNKVGVWETSLIESVAVCEMQDLALVDMLLTSKKVAFYVNGNMNRGMGHIYRVLELADEFYIKPDIYYHKKETSRNAFGKTDYDVYGIASEEELVYKLKGKNYDILINDILNTSDEYISLVKEMIPEMKIVNFEDIGKGAKKADLVINALYQNGSCSNTKSGAEFYIVPKNFLFYEPIKIKNNVENVLVTFGGADPMDYTSKLLEIITETEKYSDFQFWVIVGRVNKRYDKIKAYNDYENIHIMYDINNMPDVMSKCDVAISSRGRTGYELAILGIPTMVMAQNEQEVMHKFISKKNGFDYIGLHPTKQMICRHLDHILFSDVPERKDRQDKMLKNDLRNGRSRVMHLIRSL